jgi:CDP-glycerol glycerophosphotransferase (TagB/SpsB family)
MVLKKIGGPDPRYLAATDILIGDMSDINYEFLLFDRPVILIANKWLRKNFPDIGIKTDLAGLEDAIRKSILDPGEFSKNRKYWLEKTMNRPGRNSSGRVIDAVLKHSKIKTPFFTLLHGDDPVLKTHLDPLYMNLKKRNIDCEYINKYSEDTRNAGENHIFISAHNKLLSGIPYGYKVHIDHGVKGTGTTDLKELISQYRNMQYCPQIDLHVTEGPVSFEKTKKILGPYYKRAIMAGYPKSDILLKINSGSNRISVCRELNLDANKKLVTYAPAGKYSYPFKQGATLSREVIRKLKEIAVKNGDINILVKLKYPPMSILRKTINFIKRIKKQ